MKHYINKKSPKQRVNSHDREGNSDINTENSIEEDVVIFPPDIDISLYEKKGINARNYQKDLCMPYDFETGIGGAISQKGGFDKQSTIDAQNNGYIDECSYMSRITNEELHSIGMKGKFDLISVPKVYDEPIIVNSMISLMGKYLGKYVCLDLWNNDNIRIEKCGYLEEAAAGHILLSGKSSDELTMVDLGTVKYINIYCK